MKTHFPALLLAVSMLTACGGQEKVQSPEKVPNELEGTRNPKRHIDREGGYHRDRLHKESSFIKILNGSHFAFLQHDLNKGKDSTASFFGGRWTYTLKRQRLYREIGILQCPGVGGNEFHFTISIHNDTLVQRGVEKVEAAGVERLNIEKYVRVKLILTKKAGRWGKLPGF